MTSSRAKRARWSPETGERFQGAVMPIVSSPAFAIRKGPGVVFTLCIGGGMGVAMCVEKA